MKGLPLNLPDAEVIIYPHAFELTESNDLMRDLIDHIEWRQEHINIYGREIPQPRLSAWYGDEGAIYTYSNITNLPLPWTESLIQIKHRCEELAQARFNSVLLNYYRNGQDSMGWHQDNEPELGPEPIIASVSFGAVRRFQLRHKKRKDLETISLELTHGSLLVMRGTTQHYWKHQVAKTNQNIEARINLTFRFIYS